jgi:phage shock protein A
MGIWKKISDLARANLNQLLTELEDPKKLADQTVLDLEESKKKAKALLVKAMASTKMAQLQQENLQNQMSALKELALGLLQQGNESKAKEILVKKQEIEQEVKRHEQELTQEQHNIETLNRGLAALTQKISAFKSSSSIKASTHYIENEDAFNTFSRMEEKIENSEAELWALNELLKESDQKETSSIIPEASFDKHSDPAAIEKELLAMKKKLNDS